VKSAREDQREAEGPPDLKIPAKKNPIIKGQGKTRGEEGDRRLLEQKVLKIEDWAMEGTGKSTEMRLQKVLCLWKKNACSPSNLLPRRKK